MKVSILLASYNRHEQLYYTLKAFDQTVFPSKAFEIIIAEDGSLEDCMEVIGRYISDGGRFAISSLPSDGHKLGFHNPSRAWNNAAKISRGEVLIIAGAETYPCEATAVSRMYEAVIHKPNDAHFALVEAHLTEESWREHVTSDGWLDVTKMKRPNTYTGVDRPAGYFFFGAIAREKFFDLHGFDEDLRGYCHDDTDFEWRLKDSGSEFHFYDGQVTAIHQWHPSQGAAPCKDNERMLHERKGIIKRNLDDPEWDKYR